MARCDNPLDVGVHETPLFKSFTAHDLLILIAGVCALVACTASAYLIYRHITHYTQPKLQRLTIRIVFMVPVYSICCLLSVPFYKPSVYLAVIYEFYESLVIASFFLLLCRYMGQDLDVVRRAFALLVPRQWLPPVGPFRRFVLRRKSMTSGSTWFNRISTCVLQFCVIKFLGAIAKIITEAFDVYCKHSMSFKHARSSIFVVEIISLVTAMWTLLNFYKQTELELAAHGPLLKFMAIKLVVFLFYVQSFLFNHLTKYDRVMSPTDSISYPSVAVGIPNTVLCFEMALVSIMHLYAYPYKVFKVDKNESKKQIVGDESQLSQPTYVTDDQEAILYMSDEPQQIPLNWKQAVLDVLNFKDIWIAVKQAMCGRFAYGESKQGHGQTTNRGDNNARGVTTNLSEALVLSRQSRP
ncbi:hypothetical protein CKM354_001216200 [Cercospora kikuchii]|uniref:Uncharacterized protein n=1 Tax=Cercospora kikuchii TaxID=84275 RepID=A0A9P3FLH0_9PEZI|nr:uncharacterized protein CKM354_001216200 [Cercospora kikuchii]GIZ49125.1 hypothetical protein CKM354_001216200 [Cercospora kikuchii]